MYIINFVNPTGTDEKFYDVLINGIFQGFKYEQVRDDLKMLNCYIPEDQFNAFKTVLDIQIGLDIGDRQNERMQDT